MKKEDLYIKQKLQEDRKISIRANEVFKEFEGGIKLENNKEPNEKKIIKISLKSFMAIAASVVIVGFLGVNVYTNKLGKPNIYTGIKNMFSGNQNVENVPDIEEVLAVLN